jgi:NTP pyrophosphatase (non-canonical NTP hydrolase)
MITDNDMVQELVGMQEYQELAKQTDQNRQPGMQGLPFLLLGLFGEVGTLLSALKKRQRDQDAFPAYRDAMIEEFGDVIWYFSNIATRANQELSVLAQRAFRDFGDWDEVQLDHFGTFADIQSARSETDLDEVGSFEQSLFVLAGRVGSLMNDFQSKRVEANRDVLTGHLVEILRALIESAELADICLQESAQRNLTKIFSRWPGVKEFTPLFDEEMDVLERIPRRIEMHIFEQTRGSRQYVFQQCNGINIGSALTDNRMPNDDYRFHDVFHLAYAAVLGWSPVIRALFNVKRKSRPDLDENQDGARAILIEEGISAMMFNRGASLNYYSGVSSVDYTSLKLIRELVNGYEVEKCHLWQWEKAILDGFEVCRTLRDKRRGRVIADLVNRTITFEKV